MNLIALIAVFAVTSHEVHAWFGTKLVLKLNTKWRKVESVAMRTFWFVSVASRSGAGPACIVGNLAGWVD